MAFAAGVVACLAPTLPATAQEASATDIMMVEQGRAILGAHAVSARHTIGAPVFSAAGERLGSVANLVLDSANRIQKVVVSSGTVLGVGGKNVQVEFKATVIRRDQEKAPIIQMQVTPEEMDNAPSFDPSTLASDGDRLASSFIDRTVTLAAMSESGKIHDLILNEDGTVEHLIVEFGGVLGVGQTRFVVAPDKLATAPEGKPMSLSLSKSELEALPRIKSTKAVSTL
ncbi:PRC-barrel domain-containing protein [Iodidimonas sp. SYSU 1G8]|uniref:PRC-barrel domain containing protein n=1 Tax=Iodidimonas sp. SYSU 1G8 TaxID=3133967 RepID=UPI0031FEAD50